MGGGNVHIVTQLNSIVTIVFYHSPRRISGSVKGTVTDQLNRHTNRHEGLYGKLEGLEKALPFEPTTSASAGCDHNF